MTGMAGGSTTTGGHMRQRSRYACVPCRQRKRKCDGTYPCSTCTGYGYNCQYKTAREPRGSNNSSQVPKGTKRKTPDDEPDEPPTPHTYFIQMKRSSLRRPGFEEETTSLKEEPPSKNGFLIPWKGRFIGRHSSVAFPQWVGKNLQSARPPRVHSFAYNTGVRRELSYAVTFKLDEYLTWTEVYESISSYETVVHPIFGFVDIEHLRRRSHDHWHGKPQGPNFEALISGIVAVASLFSESLLSQERELRIVQHVTDVLDDPAVARFPTLDTMSAWTLRTIYTRSTSRPGITWQYSCTMMHVSENIGACRRPQTATDDSEGLPSSTHSSQAISCDLRARLFIVARSLHIFISYEHGRSTVDIGPTPEHSAVLAKDGDLTLQFSTLVDALPPDNRSKFDDQITRREELYAALDDLLAAPADHEFLTLIRADLCFCVYRRLRLLDLGLGQKQVEQVIQTGKTALPAARILVLRNHPWWNIVGSVFQFLCVLLAIDNTDSLAAVPETMDTLETITKHLQTHLANEALSTANLLVRAMKEKKRREIEVLERVPCSAESAGWDNIDMNSNDKVLVDETQQQPQQPQQWNGMVDFTDPMWNWDAFFEPFMASGLTASSFAEPGLQVDIWE